MIIDEMKEISNLPIEKQKKFLEIFKEEGDKYNIYPMTYQQKRLWRFTQLAPDLGSCNGTAEIIFKGIIHEERIEKAIYLLLEKDEILRTIFLEVAGEFFQVIKEDTRGNVKKYDFRDKSQIDIEAEYRSLCLTEYKKPFYLNEDIPFRANIVRISENECRVCLTMHHICFDGWALLIMKNDFLKLYENPEIAIKEIESRVDYLDYSAWQQKRIKETEYKNKLMYFCKLVEDAKTTMVLPGEKVKCGIERFQGKTMVRMIGKENINKVNSLAGEYNVSNFAFFLTLFVSTLYCYTNQKNIITGFPTMNREQEEFSKIMGFCTNAVIVRADFNEKSTFEETLRLVNERLNESLQRQEVFLEHIVDTCEKNLALPNELFIDKVFSYQDASLFEFDADNTVDIGDASVTYNLLNFEEHTNMRYRLMFTVQGTSEGFVIQLGYADQVIPEKTADSFVNTYLKMFNSILEDENNIEKRIIEISGEEFQV